MDQLIFCGYEFASAFVPGLIVFLVMFLPSLLRLLL